MSENLASLFAIGALALIEITALATGHDGTLLVLVVSVIAGLAGYHVRGAAQ